MFAMTLVLAGSLFVQSKVAKPQPEATDHRVIESVLKDLSTVPNPAVEPTYADMVRMVSSASKPSGKSLKGVKEKTRSSIIYFSPAPLLGRIDTGKRFKIPEEPSAKGDKTPIRPISPSKLAVAREAEDDAANGHPNNVSYSSYSPQDNHIRIYRESPDTKLRLVKPTSPSYQGVQVFQATPPGYSKDGQVAAVYLRFPWSGGRHSGLALYVLERQIGEWKVISRRFSIFF
jgi:hypothetical protein